MIEEADLDARSAEFIQQKELISIVARQTIGSQHVEAINCSLGSHIPQPLQGRPQQRATAVSVVYKLKFRIHLPSTGGYTMLQGRHLAGDGVCFGLAIARDASVPG